MAPSAAFVPCLVGFLIFCAGFPVGIVQARTRTIPLGRCVSAAGNTPWFRTGLRTIFADISYAKLRQQRAPWLNPPPNEPGLTMRPNTKKLFNRKPIRWDQHCLLVIQFSSSLRSEIRRGARFAEMKRVLRQSLDRFAPGRALDFFRHPGLRPCRGGHPGNSSAGQESRSLPSSALPV